MHCKSYSHFFSKTFQHICLSVNVNFNELLTNDVVSFEQLGPACFLLAETVGDLVPSRLLDWIGRKNWKTEFPRRSSPVWHIGCAHGENFWCTLWCWKPHFNQFCRFYLICKWIIALLMPLIDIRRTERVASDTADCTIIHCVYAIEQGPGFTHYRSCWNENNRASLDSVSGWNRPHEVLNIVLF